jgi:hypothetical protein
VAVTLWSSLLVAAAPLEWAPVPPAVVVVALEATAKSAAPVSRADLIDSIERWIESRARAQVKVLSPADLLSCGGDPLCRIRLARAERSELLLSLYLHGREGEITLGLTVFTTTTTDVASNERPLLEAVNLPLGADTLSSGALDTWLGDNLSSVLAAPLYVVAEPRRLEPLPMGTVLQLGASRLELSEDAEVTVIGLPSLPATLRVEPPDYEVVSLPLAPREPTPAVAFEATSARWVRRGIFGSGVAGVAVAATGLGVAAATSGTVGFCARASAADCSDGYSPWVSVAVTGAAYALPIMVDAALRDEAEAGPWGLIAGLVAGAVGATVMIVGDR